MMQAFKKAAALTAAALFLYSCQKPVFVPEKENVQGSTDEVGVYEEGLYVTENGSGGFTGADWKDAMSAEQFRSLVVSGEIEAGTTVHLAHGCYSLSTDSERSPKLTKSIILKGGYTSGIYTQYPEKYPVYLTGNTDWHIVEIPSGVELTLDGVGFTGGTGSEDKGAVCINGGTLRISNAVIFNNYSPYAAGAIQITNGGRLEATSCVIRNNVARSGGAISVDSAESSCIMSNCNVTANLAHENGGAVRISAGTVKIEGCTFSGNESVKEAGGAFCLEGGGKLECINTVFDGERTGYRGALLGFGGDDTQALFNGCILDNCHSIQSSALFYHSSGKSKLYLNACTLKDCNIDEKYGTIAVLNNADLSLGFNNCSMTGAYSTFNNANSQQCCWFNINSVGRLTISNSSLIGVPRSAQKELPKYGFLRFNGNDVDAALFNNIIVSTSQSGCSIYGGDTQTDLTITGLYNRMSPVSTQVAGTFEYRLGEGDSSDMFASDFPELEWDGKTWIWENTTMTTPTASVNAAIQAYDADFYTWLSSIGALGKDCYGNPRGENSWPGSYQK